MTTIDLKEISEECAKFKTDKLLKIFASNTENEQLKSLIDYETRNTKNFIMHDKNKQRKKRDRFFNELIDNIENEQISSKLKKILKVCQVSEIFVDDIKAGIENTSFKQLDINHQCWSVIELAFAAVNDINGMIDAHALFLQNKGQFFNLTDKNILDYHGKSFSPESALDKVISYLTLTLKMISYENNLVSGNEIVIPEKTEVSQQDIKCAASIFYFALVWNDLITCTQSCILFDNELEVAEPKDLNNSQTIKNLNFSAAYYRYIDLFERYDAISNERLYKRITQNYWEALSDDRFNILAVSDITKWSGSLDNNPIIPEELPSLVALMEAVASRDMHYDVLGLSLKEWVRAYSVICYLARNAKTKLTYSNGELTSVLRLGGLSFEKANKFISYITFGNDSRDIYDSPLIKTSNLSYLLFTPAITTPLMSNIILSKFSSKQAKLSKKGLRFEKDVISNLDKNKIINKSFKFKRDDETYEYDAIFLFEDKAFILECKNTNLSGNSLIRASEKKKLFQEASEQVKRLVNGLVKHPEVFKEHFNEDIEKFELVPVIMNNLPFSIPGKFNDVYITDSSSFGRLLSSRYINSTIINSANGKLGVIERKPVTSMWSGEALSSSDIINHFNNPVQLREFINFSSLETYPLKTSDNKLFYNIVTETDYDAISTAQDGIFKGINVTNTIYS